MSTEIRQLIDYRNDRDATLKLIEWFDVERVRGAKILVVGAGAIGNEALKNLALLGIGHIFIIDRDTIEMSNLSRSVLYRASDSGKDKVAVAARAVRELNPNVKTTYQKADITIDVGLGWLRRMDVVIGCLDNNQARLYINRACWKVGKPWIDAGIGQLNGQVRVFMPGHGACYECSFSEAQYDEIRLPCNLLASKYESEGKIPTTPTIASIMGAVQVQEALKLLDASHWEGRTLSGREFLFNGTVGEASVVSLPEKETCFAHSSLDLTKLVELENASAKGTTAAELLAMARQHLNADAVIVLNFELCVEMRCPNCQQSTRMLRPERKIFREELVCAACGNDRYLVTTHTLGGSPTDYQEDFLDAKLADLGVPSLEILEARGQNGVSVYLELTGDVASALSPTVE
ncbi:MAG TPA: ThiF family adenylyltransferase [Pyrinomonadaceae bacterium]|nr:ThiF family adenylyltransferase [Pyrinomonadaceae bacterium]